MSLLHYVSYAMRNYSMLRVKRCFFAFSRKYNWLLLCSFLTIMGVVSAACTGLNPGGNTAPNGQSTPTTALTSLHWCGKPLMVFRDEGAAAVAATVQPSATSTATVTSATPTSTPQPRTITNWSQVKPALGFTVYLPATLPQGTCLVSASGTLHDPIFGSSFTIGYLLPDHSALSLSEAPLRSQNPRFQCSPASTVSAGGGSARGTPTPAHGSAAEPLQLCSGALKQTSIVFSARGKTAALEQLFHSLQPNVDWVPAAS
jgi:hypothetical protein